MLINKKNGFINNYEKENVNSGGQQFHHYQQNEQESLASNDWAKKDHDIWCWKSSTYYL